MPGHPQSHQQVGRRSLHGHPLAVLQMLTEGPGHPGFIHSWVRWLTPICASQILERRVNVGPGMQTLSLETQCNPVPVTSLHPMLSSENLVPHAGPSPRPQTFKAWLYKAFPDPS